MVCVLIVGDMSIDVRVPLNFVSVAAPGRTQATHLSAQDLSLGRSFAQTSSAVETSIFPSYSVPLIASVAGFIAQRQAARRRANAKSRLPRLSRGGEEVFTTLKPTDQWIGKFDLESFGREVNDLGEQLKAEQGQEDQKHLKKMIWWSRICAAVGLGTMWMGPNPLSIIALSLWTHSAWAMIGHHVCHGGYNRTDASGRYSSRGFALGSVWRRLQDWFDWMLPEAWSIEHNQLHHYRLSEDDDPDLLERNAEVWKGIQRYTMPFLSMFVWKWAYYAPNTYKELKVLEMRNKKIPLPAGFDPQAPITMDEIVMGKAKGVFSVWELFSKVIGPYFLFRFFILPAPLALINPAFYTSAVINLFAAELLANLHGFVVIVPNHSGSDLYRFARSCKPKSPTFYLRAIISSANFSTGGNLNDFMHGWLNYQIEHHCWPDLSMLSYQKGQPRLKKLCEKYGVPYVQENVFVRLKKTLQIAMGLTFMRRYPDHMERDADMMVWKDQIGRSVVAA